MIKLSDRLKLIADQIEKNQTMADIGTDHGFLPIYLWEREICPKVILTDISKGSLEKARINCMEQYPDMNFDLRLGDGIKNIKTGEVDVLVIAGMGGTLMTEILGFDMEKTRSFKKIILQPRNSQGSLRHWLITNGLPITKESLVREGKYICEIITAIPHGQGISHEIEGCNEADMEYETPTWILSTGDLAHEFIENKLRIEENIQKNLLKGKRPNDEKTKFTEKRIQYLKTLLRGEKCL
ncbi:MAG: class I SAM-dependent methyltransferase [Anaerovoracaceae bacterium]